MDPTQGGNKSNENLSPESVPPQPSLPPVPRSALDEVIHVQEMANLRVEVVEKDAAVQSIRCEFLRNRKPFITYSLESPVPYIISVSALEYIRESASAEPTRLLRWFGNLLSSFANSLTQVETRLSPEHAQLLEDDVEGIFPDLKETFENPEMLNDLHVAERWVDDRSEALVARIHHDLGLIMIATSQQGADSKIRLLRVRTALSAGEPMLEHSTHLESVVRDTLDRFYTGGCETALAPLLALPELAAEIPTPRIKRELISAKIKRWASGSDFEDRSQSFNPSRKVELLIGNNEAVLRFFPALSSQLTAIVVFKVPFDGELFSAAQIEHMECLRDRMLSADEKQFQSLWDALRDKNLRPILRDSAHNKLTSSILSLRCTGYLFQYDDFARAFDDHEGALYNLSNVKTVSRPVTSPEALREALHGIQSVGLELTGAWVEQRPDLFHQLWIETYRDGARIVTICNGLGGEVCCAIPEGAANPGPLLVDLCTRFSKQAEDGCKPLLRAFEEVRSSFDPASALEGWETSLEALPKSSDHMGTEMLRLAGVIVAHFRTIMGDEDIVGECRSVRAGECELLIKSLIRDATIGLNLKSYTISRLFGRTILRSSSQEGAETEVGSLENLSIPLLGDGLDAFLRMLRQADMNRKEVSEGDDPPQVPEEYYPLLRFLQAVSKELDHPLKLRRPT